MLTSSHSAFEKSNHFNPDDHNGTRPAGKHELMNISIAQVFDNGDQSHLALRNTEIGFFIAMMSAFQSAYCQKTFRILYTLLQTYALPGWYKGVDRQQIL